MGCVGNDIRGIEKEDGLLGNLSGCMLGNIRKTCFSNAKEMMRKGEDYEKMDKTI